MTCHMNASLQLLGACARVRTEMCRPRQPLTPAEVAQLAAKAAPGSQPYGFDVLHGLQEVFQAMYASKLSKPFEPAGLHRRLDCEYFDCAIYWRAQPVDASHGRRKVFGINPCRQNDAAETTAMFQRMMCLASPRLARLFEGRQCLTKFCTRCLKSRSPQLEDFTIKLLSVADSSKFWDAWDQAHDEPDAAMCDK